MSLQNFNLDNNPSHYAIFSGGSISPQLTIDYSDTNIPFSVTFEYAINGSGCTFINGSTTFQVNRQIMQLFNQSFSPQITLIKTGTGTAFSISVTATIPGSSMLANDSINILFVDVVANMLHPILEAELMSKINIHIKKAVDAKLKKINKPKK